MRSFIRLLLFCVLLLAGAPELCASVPQTRAGEFFPLAATPRPELALQVPELRLDTPALYGELTAGSILWSKFDPEGLNAAPLIVIATAEAGVASTAGVVVVGAGVAVGVTHLACNTGGPIYTDKAGSHSGVNSCASGPMSVGAQGGNTGPRSMTREQQDQVKEAWSEYLVQRQVVGEDAARHALNQKLDDSTSAPRKGNPTESAKDRAAANQMIDPGKLRLPPERSEGADKEKLREQIEKHGTSTESMPNIEVTEGANGEMVINNGVTRATRGHISGKQVPITVTDRQPDKDLSNLPTVKDKTK